MNSSGGTTFSASGFPAPTYTVSGTLPAGLALINDGNGLAHIAGTPAAGSGGVYTVTVIATNSTASASVPYVLTVNQPPALNGPTAPRFNINVAGSVMYTTTGFPVPAITRTGGLPSGLTFVDNGDGTATLSGTPAFGTGGNYPITITAANGVGVPSVLNVTIVVVAPLAVTTTSLPNGSVGVAYSQVLAANGGQTPYTWSLSAGALPAGLALSAGGTISGSPTGPVGTFSFTVKVTDSLAPAQTATKALSITIGKGPTTLTVNPVSRSTRKVSGRLTGGIPGVGLVNQSIVFKTGNTTLCTVKTNTTGNASCTITAAQLTQVVLNNGVTGTYAGSALWQPASGAGGVTN